MKIARRRAVFIPSLPPFSAGQDARPDSAMPGIAGCVLSPFSQAEPDKIKKLEPITNAIFDKILAGADLQILLKTYAKVKPE